MDRRSGVPLQALGKTGGLYNNYHGVSNLTMTKMKSLNSNPGIPTKLQDISLLKVEV